MALVCIYIYSHWRLDDAHPMLQWSVSMVTPISIAVCVFALHIAGQSHQIIVLQIFIGNFGAFLIWLCVVRIRDLYPDYPDCSPKMANMFVHRHVISEHVFVIWLMECKIANRPLKWRIWIMVSKHIQVVGKIRTNETRCHLKQTGDWHIDQDLIFFGISKHFRNTKNHSDKQNGRRLFQSFRTRVKMLPFIQYHHIPKSISKYLDVVNNFYI